MDKNKLMMIIIIVLLVLLLGSVIGLTFLSISRLGASNDAEKPKVEQTIKELSADQIVSHSFQKGESFIVNLSSSDGKKHAIKVSVAVGINNTEPKEATKLLTIISDSEVIALDAINRVLSSFTYEELSGSDRQEIIREELLTQLQELFDTNLIVNVYIDKIYID